MRKKAELMPGKNSANRDDIDDGEYIVDTGSGPEHYTEADKAAIDFMARAVSEGSEAQIILKRELPDGKTNFCETMPVDRYDYYGLHNYIQETYGGGAYRIYLTKKGVAGLLQNTRVTIEQRRKPDEKQNSFGSNDIALALLQEIRAMRQAPPQLAGPTTPSRREMLEEMMLIREAFAPPPPPDTLAMLTGVLALAGKLRDFAGGSGGETVDGQTEKGFGDILLTAVEKLAPVAVAVMSRPQAAPPASQRRPHGPRRPAPQAAPQMPAEKAVEAEFVDIPHAEESSMSPYAKFVPLARQYWPMVKLSKLSPKKVFDMASERVEELSDEDTETLISFLAEQDPAGIAIQLMPELESNRAWIEDLIEWLRGHAGLESKYAAEFADEQEESIDIEPHDSPTQLPV